MSYEALVRDLYQALSDGVTGEGLARFFAPDAEQVEYPSAVRPTGSRRLLAEMLAASEQGAGLLSAQSFEVLSYLEQGSAAAVQLTWRATLAVPMGRIPAGGELVAHVGAFYEFADDGRIARQSSYDCYEPFPA
ncbi:MAG TPA: nuclear transport factor 2 family protein [Lapillicoccus sp.]|jgi:ketosteroid isomerase-like protein